MTNKALLYYDFYAGFTTVSMSIKVYSCSSVTYYFSTQGWRGLRLWVSLEDAEVPLFVVCESFGLADTPFRNASMLCQHLTQHIQIHNVQTDS